MVSLLFTLKTILQYASKAVFLKHHSEDASTLTVNSFLQKSWGGCCFWFTRYRSGSSVVFRILMIWPQSAILLPYLYTILLKTVILSSYKSILFSTADSLHSYFSLPKCLLSYTSPISNHFNLRGLLCAPWNPRTLWNSIQTFLHLCIFMEKGVVFKFSKGVHKSQKFSWFSGPLKAYKWSHFVLTKFLSH